MDNTYLYKHVLSMFYECTMYVLSMYYLKTGSKREAKGSEM